RSRQSTHRRPAHAARLDVAEPARRLSRLLEHGNREVIASRIHARNHCRRLCRPRGRRPLLEKLLAKEKAATRATSSRAFTRIIGRPPWLLPLSRGASGYSDHLVRERLRQPERWEHPVFEARQGADAVAGEREHKEAGGVTDAATGGTKVGAERGLAIRSRRHEVVRSAAHEAGAEARDNVAAVVFERNGRHGHADVACE